MTTSIQSCIKIAKNEPVIPIEQGPIQIVDVATGVILKPKAEPVPRKKITTILHRLSTPKVHVRQMDASLFNDKAFEAYLLKHDLRYDPRTRLFSRAGRCIPSFESTILMHEFEMERRKTEAFSVKHLMDFEAHLSSLKKKGWEISKAGGFGVNLLGDIVPLSDLEDDFDVEQMKFRRFLDGKGIIYESQTDALHHKGEKLPDAESLALVKEFQNLKDRLLCPDESFKKVKQHEAECPNPTPEVRVDVVAKKSLKTENQLPRSELMPDSAKLRSTKDGCVKFSLKALLQYEYFLDHLYFKGAEGTKQEFLDIQGKFKAFLERKGLQYDSNSELLVSNEGALSVSEIYNLIGEFESGRDDGQVTLKSSSRKKPVEISAEEQKTKLILRAFYTFDSYLEMLEKDGWTVNRERKFAADSKGKALVFSALEEKFKGAKEYFRIYLEENKLQYDPNSGWIAGVDFFKTQEIIKTALREIKVKTTFSYYMEFEGALDAMRRGGFQVDMEKRISIDPEGHTITFEEIEQDFNIRKQSFMDYFQKHGKEDLAAVIDNYLKEVENKKERLRLVLKAYTNFNYALALLKNEGWNVNSNGGYALDPLGGMKILATLQEKFKESKDSFFAFLDEKGLHYDEAAGWIANKGRVLSFEQNSALVMEYNSKDRIEAHLQFMMDFKANLRDFKKAGWQVNEQVGFVSGPKDEFFTFDELEEKRLNMRANFLKYLDSRGYRYDDSKKAIYMGDIPVLMEISVQLVDHFMNPKEQLPDFQIIKRMTLETIEYKDYLDSLRKRGWKIENETLTTPEGKTFPIQGLEGKYLNARAVLMAAAAGTNLSDFLDSMQDFIVKDFVRKAHAEFGMKYNGEKKMFEKGTQEMTVEEMVMQLSFKQLGLL